MKLVATDLTVRHPGAARAALADVSLTLHPGEVVSVLGQGSTFTVKLRKTA